MKVRDYQRENRLRRERKARISAVTKKFQEDKENWQTFPMRDIIQQQPKTHGFETRQQYLDWLSSSSSSSDNV